jgi:hypothetical protein
MTEIGRMILAGLQGDREISAQKRSAQFGDEFLAGISGIAECLAREVTVQTPFMLCPVRELVQQYGVVALRIPERLERR